MTSPVHKRDYPLEEVVEDVTNFCRATGVVPMRATRERWKAWPGRSVSSQAANQHGWENVKREVARRWTPKEHVPDGHYVKGVSTLVDSRGNTQAQWVKTAKDVLTKEQIFERLLAYIPERVPERATRTAKHPEKLDEHLLSAYIMGDPHIGMLAWSDETKDDPFDLEIAENTLSLAMDHLVAQGRPTRHAVVLNLGDFFHADSMDAVTRRSGHSLDVDSRWARVLRVGVRVMIRMVERALSRHEHVRVINEIGNHDDHSAYFLSVAMDAYFSNEERVSVDLSPARFHYLRFGKCLVGVTHGDRKNASKAEDLESIMACDRPKDWGETEHRYWWTGHIHHRRAQDTRGVMTESFRTLAPLDAWHANEGYRNRAEMTRITLHEDYGEVARASVSGKLLRTMLREG